jgi:hypothetical protein
MVYCAATGFQYQVYMKLCLVPSTKFAWNCAWPLAFAFGGWWMVVIGDRSVFRLLQARATPGCAVL